MKKPVLVITLAIAAGVAWFLASPLLREEVVDEPLVAATSGGEFDLATVMTLTPEERQANRQGIMRAAAKVPPIAAMEPMPATAPQLLAQGEFVDADAIHQGSGFARLYALPDGSHLVRLEDFRSTNGPALVVYLARHDNPQTAAEITEPGFISLGKLKGNVGNQNYLVPAGTEVSQFGSVVIWCELFGVLFSPAALSTAL